jgi:hypothetical protein
MQSAVGGGMCATVGHPKMGPQSGLVEMMMSKRGSYRAWLASYFEQLVIATVGAIVLGYSLLSILVHLIAAVALHKLGAITQADHFVQLFGDNPYWIGPVLAGFLLGAVSRRYFIGRNGFWVWVIPTLSFGVAMITTRPYGPYSRWEYVWDNFFTSRCGATECLSELVNTAPFYTSVAYSLGAVIKHLTARKKTGGG